MPKIDAHVLIDVVGSAGAVPDTVGVRDARAAVFRLDRGYCRRQSRCELQDGLTYQVPPMA